ncbi:probable mediator of RNA polymerase II transcription subunit 26b [Rhodamnia argentea]|uniref:Probable mediator of RNA polymerase II transcription subunit 26b n=1 Tax=Rhodamnia argentea TaxID=178133 RepID=A0A8B8NU17_9MYRT|nr:probable mediator of RNA polymerase II transcription subunit 26b [Rhodamnia argentea]
MPESLDDWREFFRRTNADVFELIDNAIVVAALDCLDDFRSQRGWIMERLYTCKAGWHAAGDEVGSCDAASKESMASSNGRGEVEQDVVDTDEESCDSFREAEAFTDEIDEQSRVVGEVLRIKQVLDNSRLESTSVLCESLRSLRSMAITLDTLETTKIGISVNSLSRNCRSKQIAQFTHSITGQWKAMVDADGNPCNIREKNFAIQKPKQQLGVVKPNRSSQTTPSNKIAAEKFDKERKEVAIEIKFEAAERRIQGPSEKQTGSMVTTDVGFEGLPCTLESSESGSKSGLFPGQPRSSGRYTSFQLAPSPKAGGES